MNNIKLLFLLLLFFSSCKNPKIVKDEEKFASLYVDLMIVGVKYSGNKDSLNTKIDSVFTSYNIDKAMYQNTIEYYEKNPERWQQFFEKANTRLKAIRD